MIKRIRVRGFKGIYDSKWVELSPLTVLIGRNGAGKSSLIEAIQWLQEAEREGVQEATEWRFRSLQHLRNKRTNKIRVEIDLQEGSRQVARYSLSIRGGKFDRPIVEDESCHESKPGGHGWTIWARKGNRGPSVRSILGGNPVYDSDALALRSVAKTKARGAERLRSYLRNAVFLRLSPTRIAREGPLRPSARISFLDEEGANLPALLHPLTHQEKTRELDRLWRIFPDIQGIGVLHTGEDRGVLAVRERMRAKGGRQIHDLPAWVMSEGARRLAAIFTLLELKSRPALIAIEEIENGLDPWTLREVLDALKEAASEGVQVLLTTHSPYLLDALSPDQVIYVDREEGHSAYKPIKMFADVRKYEGQVPPGIMYISDYFHAKKRKR